MEKLDKALSEINVLISKEKLNKRIVELANEINSSFPKDETLTVICVLKGSVMFCADLTRALKMPVKFEFVKVSSYGNEEKSSGEIRNIDTDLRDLNGANALIVEDIVDTGLTAKYLLDLLSTKYRIKNLKFVSLLSKPLQRKIDVDVDFVGFEIPNEFVVGYGLDYKGFLRNLDYIGYFPKN